MIFPTKYKSLDLADVTDGQYKIVPIRYEDRFDIMKWRNEQMYHLRQSKPLSEDDQERYFTDVVSQLFDKEHKHLEQEDQEKKLQELYAQIGQLKVENDFLKKKLR